MRTYENVALCVPTILLPKPGVDLTRWAVIACDQYTSEPEYWEKAAALVGDAPSTLRLIYPEVFLNEAVPERRIHAIRETMSAYAQQGLFAEHEGFVYTERTVSGAVRRGLLACLDLEQYDFHKGSTTPIRATEGTIVSRLPARVKIREGATIELPHIMVLIDDPADTVLGPLRAARDSQPLLYDFELMLGSGHVRGHRVDSAELERGVVSALEALARPEVFARKCHVPAGTPVLLHAMGDGNHSLATAKTIWEQVKAAAVDAHAVLSSPLRWALVELVNLHDPALVFEPIHRVFFDVKPGTDLGAALAHHYPGRVRFVPAASFEEARAAVDGQRGAPHKLALVREDTVGVLEVDAPEQQLPVGTLQVFLDAFLAAGGARELDYVHGHAAVTTLGRAPGNAGLYLPAMRKEDLFETVVKDGALPRKTFSMGEAFEKRFYLEARSLL